MSAHLQASAGSATATSATAAGATAGSHQTFYGQLKKAYGWYTGGFLIFVVALALLEQFGLPKIWIGFLFMFATIALYAGIGVMSHTADIAEYYVAGRRVPAMFNGMATGADWMSAASFIAMAGSLYLGGFDGHVWIIGGTGGYVLVALLIAPYLRKFGQFTIPDFLGARYGGNVVRGFGVFAAILCSFVYVVAQIYGVGLITSRFTGVEFSAGVILGLCGILVCSFLGGMRAVTWTQVAQYIILIVAYMIPVVWLSVKHTGVPLPQVMYGQVMQQLAERERELNDPQTRVGAAEKQVRDAYQQRAANIKAKIDALPKSWEDGLTAAKRRLVELEERHAVQRELVAAKAAIANYPASADEAKKVWSAQVAANMARTGPVVPHGEAFYSGNPDPQKAAAERGIKRNNFLALVFCLMVGTAALPHILMRYYTTPSVSEARQSVFWSMLCIFVLFVTIPALAVLVKFDVYSLIVGTKIVDLPGWVAAWHKIDPMLMTITDINGDGIVQLAEITMGADIVVLATPEIAGLPYVVSGLVAAGGLAAALSTADGLLLTIANGLSHDVYFRMINPSASTQRRMVISKLLLLVVAALAAYVTLQKPGNIMVLVAAAFSIAGSAFFPALVMGIFWKRANKWGALAGMFAGLGTCLFYMAHTYPQFIQWFGTNKIDLWWGIQPISAGVFGVPAGFVALVIVSLLTKAPEERTQQFVEYLRYPVLR
jgi:cation/acetate symporter